MTRINLVPPSELCDQHLIAEWRELTRIPNGIIAGKYKINLDEIPKQYTVRTNDNAVEDFGVRLLIGEDADNICEE